jgi:hypothetical protein
MVIKPAIALRTITQSDVFEPPKDFPRVFDGEVGSFSSSGKRS